VQRFPLRYGPRRGWVYLRDLRGDDEESITGIDTWSAIALLDRLLVAVPGAAVQPGSAIELGAADRDRLLAAVLQRALGNRIAASVSCTGCGAAFDLDFLLGDLVAEIDSSVAPIDGPIAIGDVRVRVPSGEDELAAAVADDPVGTLAARCVVAGSADPDLVSSVLEERAPILDRELDAGCAECGRTVPVRFSVQHYLLNALLGEAKRRASEVHRLARGYGWSLAEILSLPRTRRRDYVALVEREHGGA
jgi:hypothetical protein